MHRHNHDFTGNSFPRENDRHRNLDPYGVENDNDFHTDELRDKVASLKSLTIEIGNEVREHNKLLDSLGERFDFSKSALGASLQRLGLISKKGYKHSNLCFLLMFCVFVFAVMWFMVR